jgi:hypothetical protein
VARSRHIMAFLGKACVEPSRTSRSILTIGISGKKLCGGGIYIRGRMGSSGSQQGGTGSVVKVDWADELWWTLLRYAWDAFRTFNLDRL